VFNLGHPDELPPGVARRHPETAEHLGENGAGLRPRRAANPGRRHVFVENFKGRVSSRAVTAEVLAAGPETLEIGELVSVVSWWGCMDPLANSPISPIL